LLAQSARSFSSPVEYGFLGGVRKETEDDQPLSAEISLRKVIGIFMSQIA
jgi:hypothetical protein